MSVDLEDDPCATGPAESDHLVSVPLLAGFQVPEVRFELRSFDSWKSHGSPWDPGSLQSRVVWINTAVPSKTQPNKVFGCGQDFFRSLVSPSSCACDVNLTEPPRCVALSDPSHRAAHGPDLGEVHTARAGPHPSHTHHMERSLIRKTMMGVCPQGTNHSNKGSNHNILNFPLANAQSAHASNLCTQNCEL